MRLLEDVWSSELRPRRKEAKELGELLGDHHDLAMLRERLGAEGGRAREIDTPIERRAGELTTRAHILGARLYAAKPKAFVAEMKGWWQAAIEEIDTGTNSSSP
jgi:hypothetical protein